MRAKLAPFVLVALVLQGCKPSTPSCTDDNTIAVIRNIFSKQLMGQVDDLSQADKMQVSETKLNLDMIRTDSVQGDVGKITCSAKAEAVVPKEFSDNLPTQAGLTAIGINAEISQNGVSNSINYTAQFSDDRTQLIVEVDGIKEMAAAVAQGKRNQLFYALIDKQQKQDEMQDRQQRTAAVAAGNMVVDADGNYWLVQKGFKGLNGIWAGFSFLPTDTSNNFVSLHQDCTASTKDGAASWVKRGNGDVAVSGKSQIVFKNAPTPPESDKCNDFANQNDQSVLTEPSNARIVDRASNQGQDETERPTDTSPRTIAPSQDVGVTLSSASTSTRTTRAVAKESNIQEEQDFKANDSGPVDDESQQIEADKNSVDYWQFSRGQYSVTMTSDDGTIVQLWKNCDAHSPQEGAGHWSWNEDGWSIELDGRQFAKFAKATPPYPDDTACKSQ